MRLTELKTGEKGIIVKVLGHGSFRKRIVEMGFIRGKEIEVMLNAPLKDPIKYKILGYELSLRRSEAELIEVVCCNEIKIQENKIEFDKPHIIEEQLQYDALKERRTINVALVGNPNCGKTSLFNFASGASERVGNYSGVTVDAKEGSFSFQGYKFKLIDLPGTYSLSAYSPEELYVRQYILNENPDIIINVIDASNLERNLYLTTELIDMNVRMVVALNMYDELEKSGSKLDILTLSQLLGVPMIPTVSTKGKGIDEMFHVIINLYEGSDYIDDDGNVNPEIIEYLEQWHSEEVSDKNHNPTIDDYAHIKKNKDKKIKQAFRHIHVNHGAIIEEAIDNVKRHFSINDPIRTAYSTRYLSIKLLEKDKEIEKVVSTIHNCQDIIEERDKMNKYIYDSLKEDSETAISNSKYSFIGGALKETFEDNQSSNSRDNINSKIDALVTHKIWGYPIFIAILFITFNLTFVLGKYPMTWIEWLVGQFGSFVSNIMHDGILKNLIVDGIISGVGAVIVFLPNILILYICTSILEDSGYMARAAFIMDKLMHKIGLHGKSFIPLIMGFGCNVPAIMATRMIENKKSRLITMLINPFMTCSARLPVFIVLAGAFFPSHQGLVLFSLYFLGIILAIIFSKIFSKFINKREELPFVMELPPYRFPVARVTLKHSWFKCKAYLQKMGGLILIASIIIWALGFFPNHNKYDSIADQQEFSYLGMIGKTIEPVIKPLGFDWKMGIGLIPGMGAKELVVSTLSVIYQIDENKSDLATKMNIPPVSAYAYMVFILIYFPCIATLGAIKKESGSWIYALFSAIYTTTLAWIFSFAIYQIYTFFC